MMESLLIDLLTYPNLEIDEGLKNIQAGKDQHELGIKSVAEINLQYDCKPLQLKPGDNKLLIYINGFDREKNTIEETYERARSAWYLSHPRLQKELPDVIVHSGGLVIAEFRTKEWIKVPADNKRGYRVEFIGEEITDSPYLDCSVRHLNLSQWGSPRYCAAALNHSK